MGSHKHDFALWDQTAGKLLTDFFYQLAIFHSKQLCFCLALTFVGSHKYDFRLLNETVGKLFFCDMTQICYQLVSVLL